MSFFQSNLIIVLRHSVLLIHSKPTRPNSVAPPLSHISNNATQKERRRTKVHIPLRIKTSGLHPAARQIPFPVTPSPLLRNHFPTVFHEKDEDVEERDSKPVQTVSLRIIVLRDPSPEVSLSVFECSNALLGDDEGGDERYFGPEEVGYCCVLDCRDHLFDLGVGVWICCWSFGGYDMELGLYFSEAGVKDMVMGMGEMEWSFNGDILYVCGT